MPKFEITVQGVTKLLARGFKRREGTRTRRAPESDSEECCQQNISLSQNYF